MQCDDEADGDTDEKEGEARVELGHVAQRDRDPLRHLLARAVAGVRPSAGRCGAGADDEREEGEQAVVEADERPGHQQVARAGAVLAGGAVDEDDRVDDEEHRRVEVHHHEVGVQLRVDDDAPEDGLGEHARHQPAAQPDEVAAAGRAEHRAEERGGDGDR